MQATDLFAPELKPMSDALFSPCRRWRYRLLRQWDARKPYANFLMLNPSTADETKLDPTCTRCRDFAEAWGYGALIVTNLFAWRATDPQDMKKAEDPVGPENDEHIVEVALGAGVVVCAWGNHGIFQDRVNQVLALLRFRGAKLHALKITGAGQPAHPLYLPAELRPIPFP